jgi:lipoprotein-anchoring transpeptidase ErfK/SrfK
MADIYVRPYGEKRKNPLRFLLPVLLIAAVVGGGIWWWLERPASEPKEEKGSPTSVEQPVPEKPSVSTPAQTPAQTSTQSLDAQRMFNAAQTKLAQGDLAEASALLGKVIENTTDSALKGNALRVQGRINIQLFLSDVPMDEKTSYVVQPGDSLDRIARQNKTTVALIRRMNGVSGNLIYAGQRLMLPSGPFVVEVDKSDRQLDLMINGKLFKRYAVGVGRYGKTPVGTFTTVVHQENPDWTPPTGGIVKFGDPRNVLGTRWMSFEDKARPDLKGFGIHGTSARDSIGGETSNGCIRMLNEDVEEVFMLIPRGTKVLIQE